MSVSGSEYSHPDFYYGGDNMGLEAVDGVLSKELEEAIHRRTLGTWSVEEALKTDWTTDELKPPKSSDLTDWAQNLPVTAGSKYLLIVESTKNQYGIHSTSHTVKRLARYGLPVIFEKWDEELKMLRQYKAASAAVAQYEMDSLSTYAHLQNTSKITVDWGEKPHGPRRQPSVIWYQKCLIKALSEVTGIPQSDILQWVVLVSGRALGDNGVIKPPMKERISGTIEQVEGQLSKRARRSELAAHSILSTALAGEYAEDVAEECQENFPLVWETYTEKHRAVDNFVKNADGDFLSEFV